MITFDQVSFAYPQRVVLREVNLRLAERRIGIVGSNGSGKSTLARLCNGLVLPSRGSVTVDGLDTRRDLREVRRWVGFVFQDPDLQIVMPTPAEDLAFSLKRHKLPKEAVRAKVASTLADHGLSEHADHPAHLLSGGQKQMLALAAIMITEPSILVLDEPTTLLDLRNSRRVMETVAALPQQVVMVTHQLDLLEGFDRVLVVEEGRVVADDTPRAALDAYRRLVG